MHLVRIFAQYYILELLDMLFCHTCKLNITLIAELNVSIQMTCVSRFGTFHSLGHCQISVQTWSVYNFKATFITSCFKSSANGSIFYPYSTKLFFQLEIDLNASIFLYSGFGSYLLMFYMRFFLPGYSFNHNVPCFVYSVRIFERCSYLCVGD